MNMNYFYIEILYIILFFFIGIYIINKFYDLRISNLKKHPVIIGIFIVFIVGISIRLVGIEKYPIFNDFDEVSIGYEAYAIGNYGVDRYGNSLPVHLVARGSGQNALYAYLSIPFVKFYGLSLFSTRIVMSLIGCITLCFVLYLINKMDNYGHMPLNRRILTWLTISVNFLKREAGSTLLGSAAPVCFQSYRYFTPSVMRSQEAMSAREAS